MDAQMVGPVATAAVAAVVTVVVSVVLARVGGWWDPRARLRSETLALAELADRMQGKRPRDPEFVAARDAIASAYRAQVLELGRQYRNRHVRRQFVFSVATVIVAAPVALVVAYLVLVDLGPEVTWTLDSAGGAAVALLSGAAAWSAAGSASQQHRAMRNLTD